MRLAGSRFVWLRGLLLMCLLWPGLISAQSAGRKVLNRVDPEYPALARRMNIQGLVRLQVTIAKDGTVKTIKTMGGHPLLIDPAVNAMKAWKYEPGSEETTTVEFKFPPAT